jgi:epoxyqueuosine reductase
MSCENRNFELLKNVCVSHGAGLFGVADISEEKERLSFQLSGTLRKKVHRAICVGVGLSGLILSEIEKEPTRLYFHHYKTANMFLDQLSFVISQWIMSKGFQACPIAASQIVDWEGQKGHLSHKRIGYLAGLGWIGRSNLLVSKTYGAQFRMATILTDMELKCDAPLKEDCGSCFSCVKACPAGAIQETQKGFRKKDCFEMLKGFQKSHVAGQYVCGVCVAACGPKI